MTDERAPARLPLPPLLDAVEEWRLRPDPSRVAAVRHAVTELAGWVGVDLGTLRVTAPPLPTLELLGQVPDLGIPVVSGPPER